MSNKKQGVKPCRRKFKVFSILDNRILSDTVSKNLSENLL